MPNHGRYAPYAQRLMHGVLESPGDAASALRRAVFERGKHPGVAGRDLSPALATYVDTVARHAYKVTDEQVTALRREGLSDDAIFEVTVAAAAGAALQRLERGLAALGGEEPD